MEGKCKKHEFDSRSGTYTCVACGLVMDAKMHRGYLQGFSDGYIYRINEQKEPIKPSWLARQIDDFKSQWYLALVRHYSRKGIDKSYTFQNAEGLECTALLRNGIPTIRTKISG